MASAEVRELRQAVLEEVTPLMNDAKRTRDRPFRAQPDFDKGPLNSVANTFDPENCLFTTHRREMYYAFEQGGALRLAEYLYIYAQNAQKTAPKIRHWQYFVNDLKSGKNDLMFLIQTMDPEVVKALICGTLSYQMESNALFRNRHAEWLKLENRPGIYYNQFCDMETDVSGGTQSDESRLEERGKGFSFHQIQHLYDQTEEYLDKSPHATELAMKVDARKVHSSESKNIDYVLYPDNRRYAKNDNQRRNVARWRKVVKETILDKDGSLTSAEKDERSLWSFCSVGIGGQCSDRARKHLDNSDTTMLYGLLNALVQVLYPEYSVEQYQVIYLIDATHADLAESLISMISSSYSFMGGLNGSLAGGTHYVNNEPGHWKANESHNIDKLFGFGKKYVGPFQASLRYQDERTAMLNKYINLSPAGDTTQIQAASNQMIDKAQTGIDNLMKTINDLENVINQKDVKDRAEDVKKHMQTQHSSNGEDSSSNGNGN